MFESKCRRIFSPTDKYPNSKSGIHWPESWSGQNLWKTAGWRKSGPWIPVQSINDAIYRLTLGYTFEIDQSPSYAEIVAVVRGLRSAAWLSALSMKTSANREIEIGKLIVQEEYFLTNIYGALSEEYDLGNSTENISRIKARVRLILQSKSNHTRHVLHPL